MKLIKECNCQFSKKCKYIKKLFGALYNLEDTYPSITEFDLIIVDQSQKKFWNGDISEEEYSFRISCGLLKHYSFEHLKWVLVKVYFENRLNELDDIKENCTGDCRDPEVPCEECRCSEECCEHCGEENDEGDEEYWEADNLTRARMRLERVEKIRYPIEVIEKREINAYADTENGKILITSGAADRLSEEELALLISHEEGHLARDHRKARKQFRDFCTTKMNEVVSDENRSGASKAIESTIVLGAAVGEMLWGSKLAELDAEMYAKKRMLKAGYSTDDVLKFFKRFPNTGGGWFGSHPHTRTIVKLLKD